MVSKNVIKIALEVISTLVGVFVAWGTFMIGMSWILEKYGPMWAQSNILGLTIAGTSYVVAICLLISLGGYFIAQEISSEDHK